MFRFIMFLFVRVFNNYTRTCHQRKQDGQVTDKYVQIQDGQNILIVQGGQHLITIEKVKG